MSSYFRTVGKRKEVRTLIKEIIKDINRLQQVVNQIKKIDFIQIIRSDNDRIVYIGSATTEVGAIVNDPNLKDFQIPIEPDGNKLTCWFMFLNFTGGNLNDKSGFSNDANVIGSPSVQNGPVADLPGWFFQPEDQLIVPDNISINAQSEAVGFSINFSFNPIQVNLQNGKPRIICCKTDDSGTSKGYGWVVWIEP